MNLTEFTAEELTYQIRLNLAQREIIVDQKTHLEYIFEDAVDLNESPTYQGYAKELDILERFITQLENARMLVGERQTVISN